MKNSLSDKLVTVNGQPNKQSERSEALETILSQKPKLASIWGFAFLILIFATVVLLLWTIRYPETYPVAVAVSGSKPSQEILINNNGNSYKILVKDGEAVAKGQVLTLKDTGVDLRQIDRLSKLTDSALRLLQVANFNGICTLFNDKYEGLGPFQKPYENIRAIFLTRKLLNTNRKLNISLELHLLKYLIENWEVKNELKAEIDGTFLSIKSKGEKQILLNWNVVGIINQIDNSYFGQFILPASLRSKTFVDQKLKLGYGDFPIQDSGYLIGIVKSITASDDRESQIVTLQFPDSMKTITGKRIQFAAGRDANMLLLGENERLLKRILDNLFRSLN